MFNRLKKLPQWARLFTFRLSRYWGGPRVMATSMDLVEDPVVAACLSVKPAFHSRLLPMQASQILGWGRKWSGRRATEIGKKFNVPVVLLEDGLLRSYGRSDPTVSLVVDGLGMHYDATLPSEFERLVTLPLTPEDGARARQLIALWRQGCLSKYNSQRDYAPPLPERYVLVVDQTLGDASIGYGLADLSSFERMLTAALDENPDCTVLLKTHPDTSTRGRKGHFDVAKLRNTSRVKVITDACHPVRLIAEAQAVYTVTSQVGFEALLWGKPVRTFGMGFYAGWGLTDDALAPPSRRHPVPVEQLVYAALVRYPRYVDPVTMQPCEAETAIAHITLQRQMRLSLPPVITAMGFSRWKKPFLTRFLRDSRVTFRKKLKADSQTKAVAVWGGVQVPGLPDDTPLLRIEDGFLRSSGLGADLVRPLSLVIDDRGIYYDATRPSRLEIILSESQLNPAQVDRARALRRKIIDLNVTKYNLGHGSWAPPSSGQRVILVVGQVETDASIRLGSPAVVSNVGLLARVRAEHPDAYLVYKPHPDVLAGLRNKGIGEGLAQDYCNEILTTVVSSDRMFSQIDELHTMTSLMGFEALMRGVKVVCHGMPFYAGWGLTEDRLTCARRNRQLSIDELVYGALVQYPRYFDSGRNFFVGPEQAVEQLAAWSRAGPQTRRWHRKLLRAVILVWRKLTGSRR